MPDLPANRLNELSAAEMARQIADGATTSEAVIRDCLERIHEREETVRAWAFLDPELALQQARACDRGPVRGPLHGVPLGIKDIIDTADMPTEMGSPIYAGHRPASDAACVAVARAAGAVIMGKTVTAEFAGVAPGATANPHNPAHTPGGSSSGSAAAVADFMVAGAFGTQTGGSVLRPSSYCGIVGFKPTFGTINRAGIKFAAESLDTIGLHSRTIEDAALLAAALTGRRPVPPRPPETPPRIGLCRTYLWHTAQPETVRAVEDAAARLSAAGAEVQDIVLPESFDGLSGAREASNNYERARSLAYEWNNHRARISEQLQGAVRKGLEMPFEAYVDALRLIETCRAEFGGIIDRLDVVLAPSVEGEAPAGLGHTGNHGFQSIWTMMHAPAITLPTHTGPNGLPVGIQLVGALRGDDRLLAMACWVQDRLGPAPHV